MSAYTDILLQFAKAFAVGGAVCTVAQVIINCTKLTSCRILVIFLLSGVVLGALGLYDYLVDFAGAGATVPISGFGWLLAKGAMRGAETGLFGALTGRARFGERGRDRGGAVRLSGSSRLPAEEQKELTHLSECDTKAAALFSAFPLTNFPAGAILELRGAGCAAKTVIYGGGEVLCWAKNCFSR